MGFSAVFGAEDKGWLPPVEDDKLKNGKRTAVLGGFKFAPSG